jgi:hypothetical protein
MGYGSNEFNVQEPHREALRAHLQDVLLAVADDAEVLGRGDRDPAFDERAERQRVPVELRLEPHR